MKKCIALIILLLSCSLNYANSLERFINKYKEKKGAVYYVLNRDYRFNDVPEDCNLSSATRQIVSGALAMTGVEEMVILRLDSCKKSVRERFIDRVYDAIPNDYTLLAENNRLRVYLNNSDKDYAYMLVVNDEVPSLTLSYVTNAFVRAIMNDKGDAIDMNKFERYMEMRIDGLEDALRGFGERLKIGVERLEKQIQEGVKDWSERNGDAPRTYSM